MPKRKVVLLILGLALLVLIFAKYNQNMNLDLFKKIEFGAYDPAGKFDNLTFLTVNHYFLAWNNYNQTSLKSFLEKSLLQKRTPLLTVEPWPLTEDNLTSDKLFSDIQTGKYDQRTKELCSIINDSKQPVWIRWGHEMDLIPSRYPWAQNNPQGFISSYQHFVKNCKKIAPETKYVWSPAGQLGLDKFYPGAEFVDIVGLSVFGFPDWEKSQNFNHLSFEQIFKPKYDRIKAFSKPVMIAELGVTSTKDYQLTWLTKAKQSFRNFPLLKSVIYFNSSDMSSTWPGSLPTPDWTVDSETLDKVFTRN